MSTRFHEASGEPADALVEVRLPGYPLDWHLRAQEHYDELAREFALIALGPDSARHRAPRRLLELVDALTAEYGAVTDDASRARDAAIVRGEATVDLVLRLPPAAREASLALGRALDEADEFCRNGNLLALATPADLVAFRWWYLGEVVGQIDGASPSPWRPPGRSGDDAAAPPPPAGP